MKSKKFLWYCFLFVVLTVGIFLGKELKKSNPSYQTTVESTESKLMMVAMRCNKLEEEVNMLHLRMNAIEEKEHNDNLETVR